MTSSPKNGHRRGRRRSYEKTTPVIRLQKNAIKIRRLAEICRDRLLAWISAEESGDARLERSLAQVSEIMASSQGLIDSMIKLDNAGFAPAKRSEVWQPEPGQTVRVSDEYRDKYRQIYAAQIADDPEMLEALVVRNVLPTGEVVVQRGKRATFAARKSHLAPLAQ